MYNVLLAIATDLQNKDYHLSAQPYSPVWISLLF